jgi:hypothetical protein
VYFQQYDELMSMSKMMLESGDITGHAKKKDAAQKFEARALKLMQNQKAKTQLDPVTVLSLIPDDWEIIT